jgi:hypothetical protein
LIFGSLPFSFLTCTPHAAVQVKGYREAGEIFLRNTASREELPKALVKWYDYTKWVLDRVDGLPKNQRFVLGARLADAVLAVMELLAEVAYARGVAKAELLEKANRKIESVRWLVRICKDRNLLSTRQFAFSAKALEECGRMVGGWLKQSRAPRTATTTRPRTRTTMWGSVSPGP